MKKVACIIFVICFVLGFAYGAYAYPNLPTSTLPYYVMYTQNGYTCLEYTDQKLKYTGIVSGYIRLKYNNGQQYYSSDYTYVSDTNTWNGPISGSNIALNATSILFSNYDILDQSSGSVYLGFSSYADFDTLWLKDNGQIDSARDLYIATNDTVENYDYYISFYYAQSGTDYKFLKQYTFVPLVNAGVSSPFPQEAYYKVISANDMVFVNGNYKWELKRTLKGSNNPLQVVKMFYYSVVNIDKVAKITGFKGNLVSYPTMTVTKVNYPDTLDLYINEIKAETFPESNYNMSIIVQHPKDVYHAGVNTAELRKADGTVVDHEECTIITDANGNMPEQSAYDQIITGGGNSSYIPSTTGYPELDPNAPWYDKIVWYIGFPFYELKSMFTSVLTGISGLVTSMGEVPKLFGAIFPFLPGEVTTAISCGLIMVIILAIVKR